MQKIGGLILILVELAFSQITIDFNIVKSIPYRNLNGFGHSGFYYEQTIAYKEFHRLLKLAEHQGNYPAKYLRLLNIFSYRENTDGSLMDYAEKMGGRPYDEERYPGDHFNFGKVFQVLDELNNNTKLKLLIEYSFMPVCLAAEQYVGNFGEAICSPPKSYDIWENIIFRTHSELIARYGASTINSWRFGVWNEPNFSVFWKFNEWGYDGFIRLYDIGNDAMRNVPGALPITGGPDNTAVMIYSKQFVNHTKSGVNYATNNIGSQTDAFTCHQYSTNPRDVLKDMWQMCKDVIEVYGTQHQEKQVWITETAPTGEMWSQPYVQNEYAACWWLSLLDIAYETADLQGEFWLPKMILFHGDLRQFEYRSIGILNADNNSTQVLKTPLFNLWEMMTYLSPTRLQVQGCNYPSQMTDVNYTAGITPDQVRAIATKSNAGIQILLYHFDASNRLVYNKMDDGSNPAQSYGNYKTGRGSYTTQYFISGIPFSQIRIRHFVIDETRSNVFAYRYKYNLTSNFAVLDEHDDLEQTAEFQQNIYHTGTFRETVTLQENSILLVLIDAVGDSYKMEKINNLRLIK